MKDVRKGRTHAGYEVIIYKLSSASEVEGIWRKVRSIIQENNHNADYDFSKSENSFVRFAKIGDELYLLAGTTGKDETTYSRKREDLKDHSSLEAQVQMLSDLDGYETFETKRGMIAVNMSSYQDEDKLIEIYSKLLNSEKDFNMDLGDMVHMSWKPSFIEDKYVIVPLCTPSATSNTWDYKEINGTVVNLF